MFFGHFWGYVGQPHCHIGWATSMPFASFNSTNPRTNPWNFHKKILRIGNFEKLCFFESAILNLKKTNVFCFFPIKPSQSLLFSKDGSKFWSIQTWQSFLAHAKHFEGECILLFLQKFVVFFPQIKIIWEACLTNIYCIYLLSLTFLST